MLLADAKGKKNGNSAPGDEHDERGQPEDPARRRLSEPPSPGPVLRGQHSHTQNITADSRRQGNGKQQAGVPCQASVCLNFDGDAPESSRVMIYTATPGSRSE